MSRGKTWVGGNVKVGLIKFKWCNHYMIPQIPTTEPLVASELVLKVKRIYMDALALFCAYYILLLLP